MVRAAPTAAPLEGRPGPVPHLGRRGAPPADPGRAGGPVLRAVRSALPDDRCARPGVAGRGPAGLGRLLRPRPPPAPGRAHDRRASPRRPPPNRGGARGPAGNRSVRRPCDRQPRLRRAGRRARGERRPRGRPVDPRGGRRASGSGARAAGRGARRRASARRGRGIQRGRDGTRRDRLPPDRAGVRTVSDAPLLSRVPRDRRPGAASPARLDPPSPSRPRGDRRAPFRRPLARPAAGAGGPPRWPLGVPRREDRRRGAPGRRGPARAARGDGALRRSPPLARGRPARVQPLHGRAARFRGAAGPGPRQGRARRASVGDVRRPGAAPDPPSDGEGRPAAARIGGG